jgi:hypothetical protein
MRNTSPIIFLLFILFLGGCITDEVLLPGDITGTISATDENGYKVDPGGISVTLTNDSLSFNEVTGGDGWYRFHEIPMGNYTVEVEKEGYVPSESHLLVRHIGGFSPTISNFSIQEVPQYSLRVDSVSAETRSSRDELMIYGSFQNRTGKPRVGYGIRLFVHNSPNVSHAVYTDTSYGYIMDRGITGDNFEFQTEIWRFYEKGETVYFCIYPLANISDWYVPRKEALGPPSEIFEWVAE